MEAVELRNEEGSILLLLRDTVLGAESTTSPYVSLGLRRLTTLLTVILGRSLELMSRRNWIAHFVCVYLQLYKKRRRPRV